MHVHLHRAWGHSNQRPWSEKTALARRRGNHKFSTFLYPMASRQVPSSSRKSSNYGPSDPAQNRLNSSLSVTWELLQGENTPIASTTFATVGIDLRDHKKYRQLSHKLIKNIVQRFRSNYAVNYRNGNVLRLLRFSEATTILWRWYYEKVSDTKIGPSLGFLGGFGKGLSRAVRFE